MAPLPGTTNPFGSPPAFLSVNPPLPTSNGPDPIEIDDDDDEPMNEKDEVEEDEGGEGEEAEGDDEDYVDNDEEIEDADDESEGSHSESEVNGTAPVMNSTSGDRECNPPELLTSAGAQQALHPLRRTADRVTRQIDDFAEKLDRFKHKETRPLEFESFQAAYQLVQTYRDLTHKAINDLSKQRTLKRAKLGWGVNQNAKVASPDPASKKIEDEVARLQLEAETWELLLNLISVDDPHTRARSTAAQKTVFRNLHRYSSDRQIWEQFLSADHYAMECTIILKWLEDTARFGIRDVDALITDLESQAERGQGVWAHGWLYTKESIKGQKRLRAWPQPLDPNGPGITTSLVNSETRDPLVTQLDPDAVTRQKQSLQKQDKFYERATWATCWKMLRRGQNWTKIREWSQERLENWRAASLCGSSVDASFCGGVNTPADDPTARMMNFRLQNSWRTACSALSRNPNVDDFQRAVYALLCGETQAAFSACRSWDDYVYVHLNSVVISRYQGFCRQLQRKINHSPATPMTFVPEPVGSNGLLHFLLHLRDNEKVGAEGRNPYRTMQTAIMCKAYDKLFQASAKSVSDSADATPERSELVPDLSSYQIDERLAMTTNDEDSSRIASHLYAVVRSLGYVSLDPQSVGIASVNVIGYIAALEEAGIYEPIPLYASLLPKDLRHAVLGKILISVVDPRERRQQIRLMAKHGIDMEAVLEDQWDWVWHSVPVVDHPRTIKQYAKAYTAPGGNRELASVQKDYIGTDISTEDELIIRSLEWLRYIDGQWPKIGRLGALSYRRFYINGKLAAARELSRRMRLSDISLKSFGFDVADFPHAMEDGVEATAPEPPSPTKSRVRGSHKRHRSSMSNGIPSANDQSLLYVQSQSMRELEQLITAFDALENYANYYYKLAKGRQRRDSGTLKQLVERVEDALNEASHRIDKMMEECLTDGADDAERAELEEIRCAYIPELFLEYHNALYSASYSVSSEYLTHCMNLAVQVSDNEHLTQSFYKARRMGELVDALAITSKAMVKLGSTREKALPGGETLGIWHVEPAGEQDDEFHEFVREARENAGPS